MNSNVEIIKLELVVDGYRPTDELKENRTQSAINYIMLEYSSSSWLFSPFSF